MPDFHTRRKPISPFSQGNQPCAPYSNKDVGTERKWTVAHYAVTEVLSHSARRARSVQIAYDFRDPPFAVKGGAGVHHAHLGLLPR